MCLACGVGIPRTTGTQARQGTPGLVGETDSEGSDDLGVLAAVDRLRCVTERLEFDAAVHVPRTKARRAADRHGHEPAHAEVSELVVYALELVIVAGTQTDLHREGQRRRRHRVARRDAELEVLTGVVAGVRLA